MLRVLTLLALTAAPVMAQDGASFPVPGGATWHAASKAVASGAAYVGLRSLGVSKPAAQLVASVGVWTLAKGIERYGRGHRLGPLDSVHDLGWHTVGVVSLSFRGRPRLIVGAGLLTALAASRCLASPRWLC
jgi:hypothetical protein